VQVSLLAHSWLGSFHQGTEAELLIVPEAAKVVRTVCKHVGAEAVEHAVLPLAHVPLHGFSIGHEQTETFRLVIHVGAQVVVCTMIRHVDSHTVSEISPEVPAVLLALLLDHAEAVTHLFLEVALVEIRVWPLITPVTFVGIVLKEAFIGMSHVGSSEDEVDTEPMLHVILEVSNEHLVFVLLKDNPIPVFGALRVHLDVEHVHLHCYFGLGVLVNGV